MILARSGSLACAIVLAMTGAACSSKDDKAEAQALAQVSHIECSIARGTFVAKSRANAGGELSVTCPAGSTVAFNGQWLENGASFSIKPRPGINVLHVEQRGDTQDITDIPFLFGEFKDARTQNANAVALRV